MSSRGVAVEVSEHPSKTIVGNREVSAAISDRRIALNDCGCTSSSCGSSRTPTLREVVVESEMKLGNIIYAYKDRSLPSPMTTSLILLTSAYPGFIPATIYAVYHF